MKAIALSPVYFATLLVSQIGAQVSELSSRSQEAVKTPENFADFPDVAIIDSCQESKHGAGGQENKTSELIRHQDRLGPSSVLSVLADNYSEKKHLPRLTSSFNPNDANLLRACDSVFHPPLEDVQKPLSHFGQMTVACKAQTMVYSDLFFHKYDSFQELKLAAGPDVDQDKCLAHLSHLVYGLENLKREQYRSRDINLYRLIDTFGQSPSGLLLGNTFSVGMYDQCLRLNIHMPQEKGGAVGTRYCVANLKMKDWQQIEHHDLLKIKFGVCLPRSCDSLNHKNKYEMIWKLVEPQLREIERDQLTLDNLYCLPDSNSPLRSVFSSTGATLTLLGVAAWFLILVYATYKHRQLLKAQLAQSCMEDQDGCKPGTVWASARKTSNFGLSSGLSLSKDDRSDSLAKIYSLLSITNNFALLFETSKGSPTKTESDTKEQGADSKEGKVEVMTNDSSGGEKVVDLRCIEGIKVLAMCYVIMGHVLMCMTALVSNGREMAEENTVAYYLANLLPAFAVNSFFSITGLLTAYLMLKQDRSHSFINHPGKWVALIVYRYLRVMPMYLLVMLYTKNLAKYSGSGPLWDYGTSGLGQRKVCEQESWSWSLLVMTNFLPPLEHCIPSGWYLSNDFQFFLVTPIFLTLLARWPRIGERFIKLCILVGFAAGFKSIFWREDVDVRPIAEFAGNGFKTYVSQFSHSYTKPLYRIPAYLVGLLIGYRLFRFECDKVRSLQSGDRPRGQEDDDISDSCCNDECDKDGYEFSEVYKRFGYLITVSAITICWATPFIGSRLGLTRWSARLMTAIVTPAYHVLFAVATGNYVLLAATGHGNKSIQWLWSHSFWKPLARLSLCAVLVNVEVINYLVQSSTKLHPATAQYHVALDMICIVSTYIVAAMASIMFEAPIRGILNTALTSIMQKSARQSKGKDTKLSKVD